MLVGKKLHTFGIIVTGLLICTSAALTAVSEDNDNRPERTWRLIDELSEEERARIDFSTDTPRDANVPYLPAEPYPFEPPYTAEEMGYRIMEFPHMPRWDCVQIEDSGTLTPTGYLYINQIITLIQHRDPEGLVGQLTAKPGEGLFALAGPRYRAPRKSGQPAAVHHFPHRSADHKKGRPFRLLACAPPGAAFSPAAPSG